MRRSAIRPLCKIKVNITIALLGVIAMACSSQLRQDHMVLIEQGEFSRARAVIQDRLQNDPDLTPLLRLELQFEIERLDRIEQDFTVTEEEVTSYIKTVIPDVTAADLQRWEESKALEYMIIDDEKRYFARAGRNLFRIDHDAKAQWEAKHKDEQTTTATAAKLELDKHDLKVIGAAISTGQRYVEPVRLRIKQAVTVAENANTAGEIIRCWIPFPREIPGRQDNIRLIATEPEQHLVADNNTHLQRTVYFEKSAQTDTKTRFEVQYEYTSHGTYVLIDLSRVLPVDIIPELAPYIQEEPPHIVFTAELKKLSREIVGKETNPYLIARKLFAWVDTNIPWASAREYSTIRNISAYCYENMHGDCGIQTLLFITLCRMNAIPARWQSGWEFKPPDDSMHDWGMIYFAPYGWLPMDVTYGIRKTEDDRLKWFYVSGMDSYRLIFNDAYSQAFYPAKIHPRSETVDSQRGEVEWRGGNLYFDQWDWEFEWQVLD
ncbi:MAG: transglutaminase family protein [Candidatus Neomarinimicrobiota bacterium]